MMNFDVFLSGFAGIFRIVLLGGPSFQYTPNEAAKKHIEVLANFQKINEPGMIRFQYGKGRVFLSGPHLEIEESRTNWGETFEDPDSEWPMVQAIVEDLLN